jgi:hypothetical protein
VSLFNELKKIQKTLSKSAPTKAKDLVEEHERVISVLKSPSHKDDLEEAKRQEKELKEYKKAAKIEKAVSPEQLKTVTSGRHPQAPGVNATKQMPHPAPPPDKPHIRADTMTHLDLKLEKTENKPHVSLISLLNKLKHKHKDIIFDDPWDQAKHDRGGDQEYEEWLKTPEANQEEDLEEDLQKTKEKPHSPEQITNRVVGQIMRNHGGASGVPPETTSLESKLSLYKLYRAYKNTPHRPESLLLKYMVHRIENAYKYDDPNEAERLDNDFLLLHQSGGAKFKNSHISVHDLHAGIIKNQKSLTDIQKHQQYLHNFIQKIYPDLIVNINGEPHIGLTRGLKVDQKERGLDHALASYSHKPNTGFGTHMHHQFVPLKNVWYSFDHGPMSASSENFGPEDEWLVSPHQIKYSSSGESTKIFGQRLFGIIKSKIDINRMINEHPSFAAQRLGKYLNADHLNHIIQYAPAHAAEYLRDHPLLNEKHIDYLVEHVPGRSSKHLKDKLNQKHIDYLVNEAADDSMRYLGDHPLLNESHINRMVWGHPGLSAQYLQNHPLFNQNHINHIVYAAPYASAEYLKDHPLLNEGHINHIVQKIPGEATALKNRLNDNQVNHIVQEDPVSAALNLKDRLNENHITHIINKTSPQFALNELKDHPLLNEEHINSLIQKNGYSAIQALRNHPLYPKTANEQDQKTASQPQPQEHLTKNNTNEDISKAMHPNDVQRLNNKSINGDDIVDLTEHRKSQPPEEYSAFLNDPKKQKSEGIRKYGGISAKAIHKVNDSTYMAKPYHKKIESATKTWCKNHILGWATMANKALYNAAGIGHLCEDVSVADHQGVPMTIHKFDKDCEPKHYSGLGAKTNVLNNTDIGAKQIAIMDFLTNNLDRHSGNILINKTTQNPLAIDHERSFQYQKQKTNRLGHSSFDNPYGYLKTSHLKELSNQTYDNSDEIGDWWNSNKDHIKKEMEKQISSIKDPSLRMHIMDNFNKRHEIISDYAQHDPWSLFSQSMGDVGLVKHKLPRQTVSDVIKSLPQDHIQAAQVLDKLLQKKRSSDASNSLISLWKERLSSMSPNQIVEYYNSRPFHHLNNHNNGAIFGLLKHVEETKDKEKMVALKDVAPPFWADKYSEILNEKN